MRNPSSIAMFTLRQPVIPADTTLTKGYNIPVVDLRGASLLGSWATAAIQVPAQTKETQMKFQALAAATLLAIGGSAFAQAPATTPAAPAKAEAPAAKSAAPAMKQERKREHMEGHKSKMGDMKSEKGEKHEKRRAHRAEKKAESDKAATPATPATPAAPAKAGATAATPATPATPAAPAKK